MSVHITDETTVVAEQGSLDYARIGYANPARLAAVSSSSAATGYPADNAQRADTYSSWKPEAVQAYLEFDMGANIAVNYCGFGGHDLGTQGCRVWASYAMEASPTVWDEASDAAEPSDDSAGMLLFPSVTARYLRLYVDGLGSPTEAPVAMPRISVVHFGEVLTMPRSIYGGHSPVKLSRETTMLHMLSRGGQFLSQGFRRRGYVGSASWRYLSPSWYRANFDPFVESARSYPFFFAWRPGDYPAECVYAWAIEDIHPANMGVREFMSVGFQMKATGDE